MEESFARVEIKYMLDLKQASQMEQALTERGFYRMDFGSPAVQSLYYDTVDYRLIRDSLERPMYKEKLRLRAYGVPGTQKVSFVEVKKKYDGVVYKRRVAVPLQAAYEGLNTGELPPEAGQVGREALWMVKRYPLIPRAVIAYDRDAWFSKLEPDVRITFDRNLTYRGDELELTKSGNNLPLSTPDQRLLEIKTGGVHPLWLAKLLWDIQAKRIHFSKYGSAYLQYLRPALAQEHKEAIAHV